MQQIRITSKTGPVHPKGPRFVCEWMEASQMNRWFLRSRLAEAIAACGPESHWIETRPTVRASHPSGI